FIRQSRIKADGTVDYQRQGRDITTTFSGSRQTKGLEDGGVYRSGKYVFLNDNVFRRFPPSRLMDILRHNHPDVSQAVWNFKIIGNSGYTINVTKLDGVTEHES